MTGAPKRSRKLINFEMSRPQLWEVVNEYQHDRRIRYRKEAIETLIEKGLEAEGYTVPLTPAEPPAGGPGGS